MADREVKKRWVWVARNNFNDCGLDTRYMISPYKPVKDYSSPEQIFWWHDQSINACAKFFEALKPGEGPVRMEVTFKPWVK